MIAPQGKPSGPQIFFGIFSLACWFTATAAVTLGQFDRSLAFTALAALSYWYVKNEDKP